MLKIQSNENNEIDLLSNGFKWRNNNGGFNYNSNYKFNRSAPPNLYNNSTRYNNNNYNSNRSQLYTNKSNWNKAAEAEAEDTINSRTNSNNR